MSLNFIHRGLANTVILFMFIMGIWALVLYFRNRSLDGNFFGIVVVGEILLVVQVSLGFLLVLQGFVPPRPFLHYLYGIFALLVLPAIYYYTRGDLDRRAALIWFFTGIFMGGLALRFLGMGSLG
jgi:heme A synthase